MDFFICKYTSSLALLQLAIQRKCARGKGIWLQAEAGAQGRCSLAVQIPPCAAGPSAYL